MTETLPTPVIETDVLIVGAGPAGASLASFLAYNGIKGMMISRDKTTAHEPRAHFTNPGAWECLRDIGLEDEWRRVALGKEYYGDLRITCSLAGPELGRMHSFGSHPDYLGNYRDVSPCEHADVSQNAGEPILVRYAGLHGFKVRFSCKFLGFEEDPSTGLITSTVEDEVTNVQFRVVSKYLCGADGGNSAVARQAGLPFRVFPSSGVALNVWYEADLSHLYAKSFGHMHIISTPGINSPEWSVHAVNRVVRPYKEFVMGMLAAPGVTSIEIDPEAVLARLKELIGDSDVKITIKGIYRWRVNETYAEAMSKDNKIFCLGDATHRHSPGNGLGSNTCIQDAYNLAWKLAYVLQGKADASLLESFNAERQPVAKRIVRIAGASIRQHITIAGAMGLAEPTIEARLNAIKELGEATPKAASRRLALKQAWEKLNDEIAGLGAEMNQAYTSNAVYLDDELDPHPGWKDGSSGIRHHTISTYPGSRLPHAWLGTSRMGEKVSTHDVAGKGQFTLFTGIGGKEAWSRAAEKAMTSLAGGEGGKGKVQINVRSIGYGQDYSDLYLLWEDRRGVEEDGAVLVRPDRTVAWRSLRLNTEMCDEQLTKVMRKILGQKE